MQTVCLLQGPLGPFYADLCDEFIRQGVRTVRISLNGGDRFYSKADIELNYSLPMDNWRGWLSDVIEEYEVSDLIVYGDMRFYHREAKIVANALGLTYWAFEEGYVRPGYITLEEGGNNASSLFPKQFRDGLIDELAAPKPYDVGPVIRSQIWFAMSYYGAKDWKFGEFDHYYHHRQGSWLLEMWAWIAAGFRKLGTRLFAEDYTQYFIENYDKRLVLVPLQVSVDTQITHHSNYQSVSDFITDVLASARENLRQEDHILIKHHPMDRGHAHYGRFISRKIEEFNLQGRVTYVHDIDLDRLIPYLKSCITINSTLAANCLKAGVPTCCTGKSMFLDAGLAHGRERMSDFFGEPQPVDLQRLEEFQRKLVAHTQLSGSFYKERSVAVKGAVQKILQNKVVAP